MDFYYRIVVDFAHSYSPEELEKTFGLIADAIMDVLDPHDNSECELILGADVTHEYASMEEINLSNFVKDLGAESVMDKFLPGDENE